MRGPRPAEGSFTIAGRVTHCDLIKRELRIGDRVLSVAASVLLTRNMGAGLSIMASGYQALDPSDRWVVTHLRVG